MAARITRLSFGLLTVSVLVSALARPSYCHRKLVGGRSVVPDVASNKELQELGRYCVEEFNLKEQREHGKSGGEEGFNPLTFGKVVEVQRQVVSGIKYFLRIQATMPDRTTRMFNSVVVVKPWLQSKELLDFSPVANPLSYGS